MATSRVPLTFGKGVTFDVLPSSLAEGFCSDARHVRFEDGLAQKMMGYSVYFNTADANYINGLWVFKGSDSNIYLMSGTKTTMSTIVSGSKTALDPTYTGRDTETVTDDATPWSFANFGSVLLFTNGVDNPQNLVSPYAHDSVSDLTGAPKGDVVRVFQRHAFILGQSSYPQRVSWSDIDDYTDWTPTSSNEAGDYDLYDSKTRVVGGDGLASYFMVYSENMTFAFQYVGTPYIFATRIIDYNAGLWKKMLIANAQSAHYFMGKDNFYTTDGVTVKPIGDGVKKYIWSILNTSQMSRAFAFTNIQRGEAIFCVPTTAGTGIPDLACIYNYKAQAWTFDTISWFAATDRIPISYPLFSLDDKKIYALESTENAAGVAITGYVDSAEHGADDPEVMKEVNQLFPIVQTTAATLKFKIGFRANPNATVTWSSAFSFVPATDDKVDTRSAGSGYYWRVRVYTDGMDTPFMIGKVFALVNPVGARA